MADSERLAEAEEILRRLVMWEQQVFGGSESSVWADAKEFLGIAQ